MAIGARLETRDSADLRGAPRRLLHLEVTAAKPSGQSVQALVHNISETGLLLETSTSLEIGDEVTILLPRKAEATALVIWASDGLYGCKFAAPLTRAVLSAAQLQSAPRPTGEFSRLLSRADDAEALPAPAATTEPFGARLRRLRLARNFTLTGLAKAVGVSKPTMWKWENGEVHPRQKSLELLRSALDVSERELLTGELEPTEQNASDAPSPSPRSLLAQGIKECKERIAELAGTNAENVTITLRY